MDDYEWTEEDQILFDQGVNQFFDLLEEQHGVGACLEVIEHTNLQKYSRDDLYNGSSGIFEGYQ